MQSANSTRRFCGAKRTRCGASKSGVNDFIRAFEKCDKLSYPLLEGITNYAISELVHGHVPGSNSRSSEYERPDFEWVFR
ncbi:hypothetical protein DXC33_14375 [Clostridiaceae bacterium TF01-6]|nr:hypothetical protein DXC33_14375 [Clostridiaceae bacterium TF01-6]